MRLEIKKLFKGYDPADLMEQAMYCFGSDGGDGGDGDSNSMGMDDDVGAQSSAPGGADTAGNSNDMGMDTSVADQASVQGGMSQGVSGQENSQGSASYGTNTNPFGGRAIGVSYNPAINALSRGLTNTVGIAPNTSLGLVDDYGLYSSVTPDNVTTDPNAGLTNNAINSIGIAQNQYSPNSVTGFGLQNVGKDVSDITTADQMTTMSDTINNPLSNMLTNLGLPTTQNQINMGYTPSYTNKQITGTTGFGIGMNSPDGSVNGYDVFSDTQPSVDYGNYGDIGGNESDPIVPATRNLVSGQPICPDGYRFDDDLQACRVDTTRTNRPNNPNPYPTGDQYYRATSLDNAPVNTPSGFDFNSANNKFINQFAYRPSNYQNQMGLNGFTPFRSS